jgi:transposase
VLVETFLRKQLGLKAHTVTKVEETDRFTIVHIDRLGRRLLRCGVCRQRCRKVHSVRKPREWRDLSMRNVPLKLRYRPRRVECPRCGLRVEDFPWLYTTASEDSGRRQPAASKTLQLQLHFWDRNPRIHSPVKVSSTRFALARSASFPMPSIWQ